MALSNSQYNQLMRMYEQRQLDNEHRLARRYEEVYERIPKLRELDASISSFSLKKARLLLDGDQNALSELKSDLADIISEKKSALISYGYPEDYLELDYTCPDCKDTGYRIFRKFARKGVICGCGCGDFY